MSIATGWSMVKNSAGTDPTKFDTDGDNAGIGDARDALGTNPLRRTRRLRSLLRRFG